MPPKQPGELARGLSRQQPIGLFGKQLIIQKNERRVLNYYAIKTAMIPTR